MSFTFGSDRPMYETTTASDMKSRDVEREPRRKVHNQRSSVVLGDDSVDYVSHQMGMDGLSEKKLGPRYDPRSGASCKSSKGDMVAPARAGKDLASTSWTMGSAKWEPEPSTTAEFKWPEKVKQGKGTCIHCVGFDTCTVVFCT